MRSDPASTGACSLGAPANRRCGYPNFKGETALTVAVQNDQIDCVKILISNGANVHAQLDDGATALSLARGKREIEKLLRKSGAKKFFGSNSTGAKENDLGGESPIDFQR